MGRALDLVLGERLSARLAAPGQFLFAPSSQGGASPVRGCEVTNGGQQTHRARKAMTFLKRVVVVGLAAAVALGPVAVRAEAGWDFKPPKLPDIKIPTPTFPPPKPLPVGGDPTKGWGGGKGLLPGGMPKNPFGPHPPVKIKLPKVKKPNWKLPKWPKELTPTSGGGNPNGPEGSGGSGGGGRTETGPIGTSSATKVIPHIPVKIPKLKF
jgi:hypothetical protein